MTKRNCCNECGQPFKGADKSFTFVCTDCVQARKSPPLCRQEQTLQDAFKHGTCARLRGDPRESTYDNPAHRIQWEKGWDCCDANQQAYFVRKTAAIKRASRTSGPQAAFYIQQIGRILRDPTKPDPKEQKMKSTLAYIFASMLPEIIGVKVVFAGPFVKSYTYKALKSQNIEPGQMVVIDSPNSGLRVVTVKEVVAFDDLDPGAYQEYKWIVGPVSTGDYSAITSKEQALQAKVVELQRKAQIEQAVASLAEQVGGLDALKAIMAELSAATEAQLASEGPSIDGGAA